jgi:rod shape-determining protein MreD
MRNNLVKNIIRFLLLVIVQVFVLNKIQLNGYINPYIYVLFVLLLPVDILRWQLLVWSFVLGLSIDFFSGPLGIHAGATVFMGFLRPGVISLVGLKEDTEPGLEPNMGNFGILWFITYASIMVFLHHLLLFFLEVFRLDELFPTLLKVLISTLVSIVLIVIVEFLFVRRPGFKQ